MGSLPKGPQVVFAGTHTHLSFVFNIFYLNPHLDSRHGGNMGWSFAKSFLASLLTGGESKIHLVCISHTHFFEYLRRFWLGALPHTFRG